MAAGKVENVDVVANGGSIGRSIVYVRGRLEKGLTEEVMVEKVALPSPKTSNFSRLPIATCASKGSKL